MLVSQGKVLSPHPGYHLLYVQRLIFQLLRVVIVLLFQLFLEDLYQPVLSVDYHLIGDYLLLDGMMQLLALFFFFQLRPLHFQRSVLLVGLNGFLLDGVVPLFAPFVIVESGLLLLLLVLLEDFSDFLVGVPEGGVNVLP